MEGIQSYEELLAGTIKAGDRIYLRFCDQTGIEGHFVQCFVDLYEKLEIVYKDEFHQIRWDDVEEIRKLDN